MDKLLDKYKTVLIYLALTATMLMAFGQVRNFEFINYDDDKYVSENSHISTGLKWNNVVWIFTSQHSNNWHPLTGLSHILDCQLFGLNAGAHHLVNLLLHIANTLLLFTIMKKITGAIWQSAFVATLFALHPLHAESVAWISERKDVLSTFFGLLTMASYFHYVKNPKTITYILTLVLFALGLMSKPMIVTLPFVFLLLDYWPLNRLDLKNRKQLCHLIYEKIPFFVLAAVASVITFFVQKRAGAVKEIEIFPLTARIANAVLSYAKYIQKLFAPTDLAVFYPYPQNKPSLPLILAVAAILLAITFAVIRLGKKYQYLSTGWFWYLGTLVPVIGLVQVGGQEMADRYTYVPLIGLFLIIAWGTNDLLEKWKHRKIFLCLSSAAVVSVFSVCTWMQTSHWRNSETLFRHALKVTAGNYLACNNLSLVLIEQNNLDEANSLIKQALQIGPDNIAAYNNLGLIYNKLGRTQDEIEAYKQAIKISPPNAKPYFNLGLVFNKLGRYQEAIDAFEQAIKIEPDYAQVYYNLGLVYGKIDRFKNAIETYRQAVKMKPDYFEAYSNLGVALGHIGHDDEAISAFKQAIEINPESAEIYYNLGLAYGKLDRFQDEIEAYKQALKIKPNYTEAYNKLADAYNNLGGNYAQLGRYPESIQAFKEAIRIKPDLAQAHYNLCIAYLKVRDKDSAAREYKILKELAPQKADELINLIRK